MQISVNAATKKTHEFINKGSNYKRVVENIKKLIYLKRQYHSDIKIIYKYTIVPENIHEIAVAVEFAKSLGCDEITYGYDKSVPFILKENKNLMEQAKNKISQLINSNSKIKIGRNRLGYLGLL